MWMNAKFFKYATAIILALLIVLLLYLTSPVFTPLLKFIAAIFLPILFSTFLYYILRPIVYLLNHWLPSYLSIFAVYLVLTLITTTVVLIYAPDIIEAVSDVSPEKIESLKLNVTGLITYTKGYIPLAYLDKIEQFIVSYLPDINSFIYHVSVNLISTLTSITISLLLTPFVLFYFLKDGELLSQFVLRYSPDTFRAEIAVILKDIDQAISSFITTQITLAAAVGFFLMCGYLLIGLPHAIALALFGMVFYVIPFLGTFIAIIPALILAISISITMALKVVLVMVVAHFIDANLLTPRLMSTSLKIHPLTIILLLLAAGSLYGIFGMLLVTPTYAILKAIVWNCYKMYLLRYKKPKLAEELAERNASL